MTSTGRRAPVAAAAVSAPMTLTAASADAMGGAVVTEQQPQSITEAELAEALAELGVRTGNRDCFFPALAESIFGRVAARREPEYEPGEIYEDDQGDAYHRLAPGPGNGQWTWTKCHTGLRVGDGVPVRPLRKLVPEGSQEAAAILVAEWRGLGEQDDAVPEWRGGYRAALRKCADELGYALKEGQR
jgi:hypothetical protein